jgi:CRISPR/Cas system-associated exonuclease Cas4 (RecB family)
VDALAPRRLLVSCDNEERLRQAISWLRGFPADAGPLIVAATAAAAADCLREAALAPGGFLGARCLTLRRLAASLAAGALQTRGLTPLGRLGLEAVAARAVHACRSAGALEYFSPVADTPGFARSLADTITELRLQGLAPEAVASTGAPGRDLARLLTRYEQELAEQSLADLAIVYGLATDAARQGRPLLLLDPVIDSRGARHLLGALVSASPRVLATAPAGDDESIAALQEILAVAAEFSPTTHLPLFGQRTATVRERIPDFEFFSAAGEGLEAVEIARRLRRFAAEGLPFDRMAILLRNPDAYLPLVEDALRRAWIPAWYSRGARRPEPAGRAFLALLACVSENLSASRFAEYLSLGQVPRAESSQDWSPPDDEALAVLKTLPDPDRPPHEPAPQSADDPVVAGTLQTPFVWERILVDAAVVGGHDRWARRLRGLEQEFRLQLAGCEQEGDPRREHLERQLRRLRNLEAFALPLIDFLGSWPARALWRDWLDRLTELARRALKDPESVLSVLSELRPLDQVGPVALDEVRATLSVTLGSLRREPEGHRYGKVFVGSVEEARGRAFDVVFLPGLAEGLFPRPTLEDPLLLDEARRALDAGLAREDQRVARERLLLRLAAGAARARLVASYPRLDLTIGRPRVPSFYALELWRAAEGTLPDLRTLEKRAAQAAPTRLGWPAPLDTADAIDDAEYDLAFLSGLLREGRQNERGSSRYLLEANPHLERALRARGRRWRRGWFESDGLVNPDAVTLDLLTARHGLQARAWSPTALQQFAACPYRFLLYSIHHLRPRQTSVPLEQLDPLTRGALFHDAQHELFLELAAAGLLPVTVENLPQILDRADQVLNRVAAGYYEKLAPALDPVWRGAIEDLRTDLRGWIFELPAIHAEWQPLRFEYTCDIPLDRLHLKGRIDLVERHRLRGILRVTDHKTGKPPERPPVAVGGGETLQPVLYGLAAGRSLERPVHSGLLFYATQRGSYRPIEILLTPQARAFADRALASIEEALQQGFLPAAPKDGACQYCDYTDVCGPYEERRVKTKDPARLESLDALRCLP